MSTTPTQISIDSVSVTEYSARIARALRTVGSCLVEGEVQSPKITPGGMLVFDLSDGTAKLACKVFPTQVRGLEHTPRHGDLVQVIVERPDLWVQAGRLNIIVADIRLAGEGQMLARRRELLARLTADGLCDPARRKPLPRFPRAVGVIAGAESDGMSDVVTALQNRFAPVHIVTCAATVQGVRAPLDIIDALACLDVHPLVDVIIVARGGGSVQDLLAFDDERLCRAVFACDTPVIAAIGHTDNVPVCNHVTWSSHTPSRSAELAVRDQMDLRRNLKQSLERVEDVGAQLDSASERVKRARVDVASLVRARELEVASSAASLLKAGYAFWTVREQRLVRAREALANVPRRIPALADVAAIGARLDTKAVEFFARRAEGLRHTSFTPLLALKLGEEQNKVRGAAVDLRTVSKLLEERRGSVLLHRAVPATGVVASLETRRRGAHEQGARLGAGIRKELAEDTYNYSRAAARHNAAIKDALVRAIISRDGRVSDEARRVQGATKRRLADAKVSLAHLSALLVASDPRRRGWILALNKAGGVVRSVQELSIDEHLILNFHDGAAGAVIDHTTTEGDQPK